MHRLQGASCIRHQRHGAHGRRGSHGSRAGGHMHSHLPSSPGLCSMPFVGLAENGPLQCTGRSGPDAVQYQRHGARREAGTAAVQEGCCRKPGLMLCALCVAGNNALWCSGRSGPDAARHQRHGASGRGRCRSSRAGGHPPPSSPGMCCMPCVGLAENGRLWCTGCSVPDAV